MKMRFVSTRVHGAVDYLMAIVIGTQPWWSGNFRGGAESWIPIGIGCGILLLAALTDFAPSMVTLLPVPVHLGAEVAAGLLLASAPWLFRFADLGFKSYLALGVLEVGLAVCTRTESEQTVGARGAPIGGR
jgi:hypothetical protein